MHLRMTQNVTALLIVLFLLCSCHHVATTPTVDTSDAAQSDSEQEASRQIVGTVWSPAGDLPINSALVCLLPEGETERPFEKTAFCDPAISLIRYVACQFSEPDGSVSIPIDEPGTYTLVTRAGLFRRQRTFIVPDAHQKFEIPKEMTTLPQISHGDDLIHGIDEAPRFALLATGVDKLEDTLAKFGLGELSAGPGKFDNEPSHLTRASELFDIYLIAGYPDGTWPSYVELFQNQDTLNSYHYVILPSAGEWLGDDDGLPAQFPAQVATMLGEYVAAGGQIYATDRSSAWIAAAFPQMVEFYGDGLDMPPGLRDPQFYAKGKVLEPGLRGWLTVQYPDVDLDSFSFYYGSVSMVSINDMVDENGVWQEPWGPNPSDIGAYALAPYRIWLETPEPGEKESPGGTPLSFSYRTEDCGSVMYTAFEIADRSAPSPSMAIPEYLFWSQVLELKWHQGE